MFTVSLSGSNNNIDFLKSINGIEKEIFTKNPSDIEIENAFKLKKFVFIDLDVFNEQQLPKLCNSLKTTMTTFIGGYQKNGKMIDEIKKCRMHTLDFDFNWNIYYLLIFLRIFIIVCILFFIFSCIIIFFVGFYLRKQMKIIQKTVDEISSSRYENRGVKLSLQYYFLPFTNEFVVTFDEKLRNMNFE